MKRSEREECFAKYGCMGFWFPEYDTLTLDCLVNMLQAKNERRLYGVLGHLKMKQRHVATSNADRVKHIVTDPPTPVCDAIAARFGERQAQPKAAATQGRVATRPINRNLKSIVEAELNKVIEGGGR